MRRLAGPLIAAALPCLPAAGLAGALQVTGADGTLLAERAVPDGAEWCLRWNHSVTGGAVADCFGMEGGEMVLRRSYLHDYAAGLGDIPGRGRVRAAESGGYWIEGIDEPVAGGVLRLRVGARSVDQRLTGPGWRIDLAPLGQGARVILRPAPEG